MTDILLIRGKSPPAEAAIAKNDADRTAEDIEELARAMALIIARGTRGNSKLMAEMLDAATQLVFELAGGYAPLARLEKIAEGKAR